MSHPESTSCLVIGCGPVGALAGNLLGQRGVPTLILERESDVYHLPRAAHFDDEIMRILQAVGLHHRMDGVARPLSGMDLVDARGRVLTSFRASETPTALGHPQAHLFYQPDLERVLRGGLARYPCVAFHARQEVLSLTPGPDAVAVEVRDLVSGATRVIHARYVLGCDGARSLTRKAVGASMDDLGLHQPWLVLDLLMRRDVPLPDHAIQVCDPRRPATLIPFPPPRRRWEFMLMPGDTPEGMVDPDNIRRLLSPWLQPADYDIERAAVYTFHALVARPWRSGRVFLLGDAAHQMPPFLGQGMCAGFRDAFNLCWKIDAALRSDAPAGPLLDTYESERRPHVEQVVRLAVRTGRIIQSSSRWLGLLRNIALHFARLLPARNAMPDSVSSIPLGPGFYDPAPASRSVSVLPMPQPRITGSSGMTDLLDAHLGSGFALVGLDLDPDRVLPELLRRRCDALGFRRLHLASSRDSGSAAFRVTHGAQTFAAWFRARGGNVALLRPDRIPYGVYPVDPASAAPGSLLRACETVLALASPPADATTRTPIAVAHPAALEGDR